MTPLSLAVVAERPPTHLSTHPDTDVDLHSGTFSAQYFNPRTGEFVDEETVSGGTVSMGEAPLDGDAAVLFERQ